MKPAMETKLRILHQSDNYLVVDKPPDVLINRKETATDTSAERTTTVETLLKSIRPDLHDPSLSFGFRFVHRLDFSTSGVLCLALNKLAAAEAARAFATRRVSKYYVALVGGHVEMTDDGGTAVDKAVGCDKRADHAHRMCLQGEANCADATVRRAVTQMLVLERGLYGIEGAVRPATKLLLKPATGRRHQLRLHCRHIGHTIIGDYTYTDRGDTGPHRMYLHSLRLVLPTRIETLDVATEDPFDVDMERDFWTPTEVFRSLDDPRVYEEFNGQNGIK